MSQATKIVIAIIIISLIVVGGVYAWQRSDLRSTPSSESKFQSTNQNNNTDTASTTGETGTNLSITSLDNIWNLYTNNKYGFSIKVPKKMYLDYGSMCEWKIDSYRPKGGLVPVKIFENKNAYISSEYFYQLTGETIRNNVHYYSGCEKVTNTLSRLEDKTYSQQQSWKFVIKNVNNDNELETFIKERYGSGCKLGNKNISTQEGVYNISIQGDGKDPGETKCPINYITVLKYYPAKNKAISWNLGQSSTFVGDENYQVVYDQEMINSFKFK